MELKLTCVIIKTVDLVSDLWNVRRDIISQGVPKTSCHFEHIPHQVHMS